MPTKKAPKKAAKKLALEDRSKDPGKDGGKHHGKEEHHGKEMLHAFEHLGRLSALESLLSAESTGQIGLLIDLAQKCLTQGDRKNAADLLRAGEHLAFGSLASKAKAPRLGDGLGPSIDAEFEHLVDKAHHHWQKQDSRASSAMGGIYDFMLESANSAYQKNAFRRALEFARGAEALSHAHRGGRMSIEDDAPKGKLERLPG